MIQAKKLEPNCGFAYTGAGFWILAAGSGQFMKHPLAPAILCYGGGLLLARGISLPPMVLFGAAAGVILGALFWPSARHTLLLMLLVLAGLCHLTCRLTVMAPDDLRRVVGDRTELATLRGRLSETPSWRLQQRRGIETVHTLVILDALQLHSGGVTQSVSGCVLVRTPGRLGEDVFGGRLMEVEGVLSRPKGPAAEGLFDYRQYLQWLDIHYELTAARPGDWRLVPESGVTVHPAWTDRFTQWAQRTLSRGLPVEDESLRLLWAMALGWKTALTPEVSLPFMQTGTMHIFAISGLHIALIAGILVSLLRVVRLPRGACGLVVIPLIWFYTGATGWQASAIRSTIMMTVVIAGWSLRRPGNLSNSLAVSGFIILVWDPTQLFQAGFQLSFFVVLSIALLMPPFERLRRQWLPTDPLLPDELRPRWRRELDPVLGYLTTALATSLAAWIGSLPLIAYYFHLATPISLLANLVIVPLSSFALMCNLGSLVCGPFCEWLTVLFNHSGWFWMELMVRLSHWLAEVPGAYFHVRSPTALEFALFYGLIFAWLTGWLTRPERRRWAFSVLGVLGVLWLIQVGQAAGTTCLTVLAIGGGNALYLDGPGWSQDSLIDAGSESAAQFIVSPFLQAQGVNHLSRLFLTHGDAQHIGGASNVIEKFHPAAVAVSTAPFRSTVYRRLVKARDQPAHSASPVLRPGDRAGPWTVLHPAEGDRFPLADDSSLVLQGRWNGVRVLLLSDLGGPGQQALLGRMTDLRSEIVVAGIPARSEPLSDELLDQIKPQAIILSTGHYPVSEQANPQVLERLSRRGVPVVVTDRDGSATLEISAAGWKLRSQAGQGWRGKPDAPRR
jgi:competence protein ComEC